MQRNGSVILSSTERNPIRIASFGHAFFAVTLIGLGILGIIKSEFVPIWSGVPKTMPARETLPYLCALVSLTMGLGLLWKRTALVASRVLLTYFVIWMILFRISHIFFTLTATAVWWACGESAVMVAATCVLYVRFAGENDEQRFDFLKRDKGLRIARILYGLGMIPFGIAHFVYLQFTVPLVPEWLPWPVFWAYFTGFTFIIAGLAIISGVYARLAATLSAFQMGLFTVLVWIPIVSAGRANAFQMGEFIDSIALTAAACVVAESYRTVTRTSRLIVA